MLHFVLVFATVCGIAGLVAFVVAIGFVYVAQKATERDEA